jgi:hypothetical protein
MGINLFHRSAAPTHLLLDLANDLKILMKMKSKVVVTTEVAASSPQSPTHDSEGVTLPSRNDGVNQDHVEGFSVKREFTSTCIQSIIIVF